MKVAMAIVGVLLVMGAVGTSDFEIEQAVENMRSLWSLALQAAIGLILIAVATRKPNNKVVFARRRG